MASGKTHDRFTYALLLPVFLVCNGWLHLSLPQCLWVTGGVWFGGLFLSPDLDTRSRPFYRWGIFRFIWWPYQWAVPHRSPDSHGLLWAPIFRLIYLSAICMLAYFVLDGLLRTYIGEHPNPDSVRAGILLFSKTHSREMVLFGVGVWLGSLAHVLLDWASSGFRMH